MTSILVIEAEGGLPEDTHAILAAKGSLRRESRPLSMSSGEIASFDLVVVAGGADARAELRSRLGEPSGPAVLALLDDTTSVLSSEERFDDSAPIDDPESVGRRADLLLELRSAWRRAEELSVTPQEAGDELGRYGLDPALAGDRGLCPPARVALSLLVDVEEVNRQQMSICRLMGTSYGTFLHEPTPEGFVTPAGEPIPPTDALSPYCAYLSSQGDRCLLSEFQAARRALLAGKPTESVCAGRVRIFSVPVCLTFSGITYPLYATSVAVGLQSRQEDMVEVARNYELNSDIIGQMAQESRFWILNEDKVDEIKGTITHLAETISREVSHKYGIAFQLFRGLLREREIRRSERLLAESHSALEQTNRRLRLKNEEIYEVTHAITHDLRKPLSTLKATLGVMRSGRIGEMNAVQSEALDTSHEATEYMQELVDDLLEAARLDAGRKLLSPERVDLEPLLDRVERRFGYALEAQGISLTNVGVPTTAFADAKAVEKIFMNLIGNSISYIGEGEKQIRVTGSADEKGVTLSVEDTGMGIPEECLPEICEKFRRGSNVLGIRGTGLGLAIVKGLVEGHGGELRFESREGEGTRVSFTLPADPNEGPSNETANAEERSADPVVR